MAVTANTHTAHDPAPALPRAGRRPMTLADYDAIDAANERRIARQRSHPPLRLIRAAEAAPIGPTPATTPAAAPPQAAPRKGWRLSTACCGTGSCGTGSCGDTGCEGHPLNTGINPEATAADRALNRRLAIGAAVWCGLWLAWALAALLG